MWVTPTADYASGTEAHAHVVGHVHERLPRRSRQPCREEQSGIDPGRPAPPQHPGLVLGNRRREPVGQRAPQQEPVGEEAARLVVVGGAAHLHHHPRRGRRTGPASAALVGDEGRRAVEAHPGPHVRQLPAKAGADDGTQPGGVE